MSRTSNACDRCGQVMYPHVCEWWPPVVRSHEPLTVTFNIRLSNNTENPSSEPQS